MSALQKSVHGWVSVYWLADYISRGASGSANRECIYLIRALKRLFPEKPNLHYRLNRRSRLDVTNVGQVLEWFGRLGALILSTEDFSSQSIVLVPLPDSRCILGEHYLPRALALAEAIVDRAGTSTVTADVLRWSNLRQPSHRGGSRDYTRLTSELELTQTPRRGTLVLVDDVVTSGAHIFAGATALRNGGFECNNAICVARTMPSCEPRFSIQKAIFRGRFQAAVGVPDRGQGGVRLVNHLALPPVRYASTAMSEVRQ